MACVVNMLGNVEDGIHGNVLFGCCLLTGARTTSRRIAALLDSNALPKLEHTRCRVNRQNALFHPATCGIIQHLGNHRVSGMDIHKTLAPDKGQRVATAVTASEPFPMRRDAAC